MGKVFITRKGGPAGNKTGTPIVTITDISDTFVIADIENTDANEAKIYYEFDNADPSASSIVIAGETTETGLELNNLTPETSYVLYAKAAQEGVLFSDVVQTDSFTTLEPQAFTYELLAEVDVTTATNSIVFDNLNISQNDSLRISYTFAPDTTSTSLYRLYVNESIGTGFYVYQLVWGDGTTFNSARDTSETFMAFALNGDTTAGFTDVNVTEHGRFFYNTEFSPEIGAAGNGMQLRNYATINNDITLTTINKLTIASSTSTGIGVGSRVQLYKVNSGDA